MKNSAIAVLIRILNEIGHKKLRSHILSVIDQFYMTLKHTEMELIIDKAVFTALVLTARKHAESQIDMSILIQKFTPFPLPVSIADAKDIIEKNKQLGAAYTHARNAIATHFRESLRRRKENFDKYSNFAFSTNQKKCQNTLAAGYSVLGVEDGVLYQFNPDGSRKKIKTRKQSIDAGDPWNF